MPQSQSIPDPIEYPKVSIAGDVIPVKFRCGDIIRLQQAGIDIGKMDPVQGVEAMRRTLTLLSHGIAHHAQYSVDQLADLIDLAELPTVADAINEAFRKASAQPTAASSNSPVQ